MANKAKESLGRIAGAAAAWTAGVLVVEHVLVPMVMGNDGLETTLANRIDSVAVGQPFNQGDPKHPGNGLHLQVLGQTNAAGVQAAWYNSYENSGAADPTSPSPRLRAAVACSTLILNGGHMSAIEVQSWSTAQRNNAQNGDHALAEQEFGKAADACTVDLDHMLVGAHPLTQIEVPINN